VASSDPLVRVLRGGIEESLHRGALVVVERGATTVVRGDPRRLVYYRSASKPLQAIEVVVSGAADRFGLSPEELAVACGSHSAEARHLEAVRSLLGKAGVPESALRCGGHPSIQRDVAFEQRRDGVALSPIHSNCSGKHAAMLASARHRGEPLDGYLDAKHPVQASIRSHLAAFCGIAPEDVRAGRNGCGAPTWAVPLGAMALSVARLGHPEGVAPPLAEAATRIADAMTAHPAMVAGTGRFDTDLMEGAKGERVIAKAGAEGVHAVSVPGRALGMAVKVDDGEDRGYRAVVVEMLRRLGVLEDAEAAALRDRYAPETVRTVAGEPAGTLALAF
jgi:L-asparaginase II